VNHARTAVEIATAADMQAANIPQRESMMSTGGSFPTSTVVDAAIKFNMPTSRIIVRTSEM
jgi:hypothetical protein